MPSLEHLKKQAKLILRWHRTGHYPVAAQIRAGLPRYRSLTDAQILAGSFRLCDAQELVAKQAGFESWPALKAGIETMPKAMEQTSTTPVLASAEPVLFVSDIDKSCAFFTDKLGFAVAFVYGDPPFYGQVRRDGARLNLRHVDRPVIDTARRDKDDLLSAAITLNGREEIRQLYAAFVSTGVGFHQTLRQEPWGAKTFIVKDPDGNLLLFAGPVNEA